MTRHLLALHDTGRSRVCTHGTRVAMDRTAAVTCRCALSVVTLDRTGKALTFAYTDNIDLVPLSKDISLENVAHINCGIVLQPKFLEMLFHWKVVLFEVTRFRLCEPILGDIAVTQLYRSIAFLIRCFFLGNNAGTCFNDGYRNHFPVGIKELCHADFFADDCLFH